MITASRVAARRKKKKTSTSPIFCVPFELEIILLVVIDHGGFFGVNLPLFEIVSRPGTRNTEVGAVGNRGQNARDGGYFIQSA